ncbi:hypothetical protein [Corynebacterium epidermidicanis]|uniref:Lipoprotein n=1 Tax=Corynebacterium epidermidicanis TaxID=1050174 RepID=A0A0G3GXM5_9CORY|nr:hypothetical protein [Corynebacterium epidermidicanis]AKK04273.1 hypothetical protein CEPID_12250 [Corynebacterium epidermidicanis]
MKAASAALVLLAFPLAACGNQDGDGSSPVTTVVTVTQTSPVATSAASAAPSRTFNKQVSHEISEDIKAKMLTQTWPGVCGTESGPMVNGEFKSTSELGGFGSILTKIGDGQPKVNMLQFDFDKDGQQEMYVAASCVPGAVGWPPLLLKVNPDLTIDPGNGLPKRGIELPDGLEVGRGGWGEFRAEGDTLRLSFKVSAPGDPACCPSLTETGNYEVKGGKLVRVAGGSALAAGNKEPDATTRCSTPYLSVPAGFRLVSCDGTWAEFGVPASDVFAHRYWSDGAWRLPEHQGTVKQFGAKCYSNDYLQKLPPVPSQMQLFRCKPDEVGVF